MSLRPGELGKLWSKHDDFMHMRCHGGFVLAWSEICLCRLDILDANSYEE